ncbi:hypothetical protein E2C01_064585 [Portunus trituberculatus]|uniref:Uncharacterized protein n=1 Tax=Portunus trituberculatus TaxID=210409 RepID=A0A5B7HC83_PORTR|nr:hypothetical protein [Portunus trituberculatus]
MMDRRVGRLLGYAGLTLTKECDGRGPIPLIISLAVCVTLPLKGLPFATHRPRLALPTRESFPKRSLFHHFRTAVSCGGGAL